MDVRLHHAAVRCDAQHDRCADVSMRGWSHQGRANVTTATLVTSSEVRTIVMRAVRDRDPEITQDRAIRRSWSERRAHACGTEARGVAMRGMVLQGPEDVAGKSNCYEDRHQVKQRTILQ